MKMIALIAACVMLLGGCAKPGISAYDFTKADYYEVQNELVIERPFEETWDQLVENLSRSFYVINNIEKDSRLINVSFSSNEPEVYIDCGKSFRTYSRKKEYYEYEYEVAQSYSYKIAGQTNIGSPMTTYVNRTTSLEGRANIYVAPSENKTKISVNVRYILDVEVTGYTDLEDRYGHFARREPIPAGRFNISFNTNTDNRTNVGSPQRPFWITCYSRGKLEEDILSYATK